ncbi:Alpha/Beta hydrolase protein [Endogone sp. FLAS-F59071]|nr:Alpha/Beta hydrolase protein [Endogone sp. FLAS-F59071]|eukprot:RUS19889.1 Alpha/Beta hydrolase protein [Endogone sp. FLAS-F59071]
MSIPKSALLRHSTSSRAYLTYFKYVPSPPSFQSPGIVFIPGFQSTFLTSNKAHYLYRFCTAHNPPLSYLTYDHFAHGSSPGHLRHASIGLWLHELGTMLNAYTSGPQILVGSSMGAWLALLAATKEEEGMARIRKRIAGIVGVGASYNFTERLLKEEVPNEHTEDRDYVHRRPSKYSETGYYDVPVSMMLDSREWLLPEIGKIEVGCPVVFVHGTKDEDAHYEDVLKLAARIDGKVKVVTVECGDHRLSKEEDLLTVDNVVEEMVKQIGNVTDSNVN